MVIFNASAQHAAVNNSQVMPESSFIVRIGLFTDVLCSQCVPVQLDYFGWMPNAPMGLQRPPPACRGHCSERSLLDSFPDVNATVHGLATIYLLSKKPADFVRTSFFMLSYSNVEPQVMSFTKATLCSDANHMAT